MAVPENEFCPPVVIARENAEPPPPIPQALPVTVRRPPIPVCTHWPEGRLATVAEPRNAPKVDVNPSVPVTVTLVPVALKAAVETAWDVSKTSAADLRE